MSKTYEIAFRIAGQINASFGNSVKDAGGKLGTLQERLGKLQQIAGKTEKFAKLEEHLRKSGAQYSILQSEVNKLSVESEKAAAHTNTLQNKLAATQRSIERYKTSILENRIELRKTNSEMRRLSSEMKVAQGDTSALKQQYSSLAAKAAGLRQAIDGDTLAMNNAKVSIKPLTAELRNAKAESSGLSSQLKRAEKATSGFQQETEKERSALAALRTELKISGANTDEFRNKQARLQQQIKLSEKAMRQYQKIQGVQQRMKGVRSGALDAMISGGEVGAVMSVPVKQAMNMESAMADVKKVVDFNTPDQFKEMKNDIVGLSKVIPMAAEDLAKIVAAGGQSGIAKADLISFAESAAKMGVAFDISADEAGEMMAKWRTAFKMSQPEVIELADKINYLGNNTAASAPKISEVVRRIGPLGEVGGVASGEIAALGASMVGAGIESEVAATGVKNMILGLVAGEGATKSQAGALATLGLNATEMAKRMQTDAKGAIIDVLTRIQGLDKYQQASVLKDLFGSESLGAIAPLLSNLDNLQKNLNMVSDKSKYTGSMQAEFAARIETTEAKLQLAKNAAAALGIKIGDTLLPWVQKGANEFTWIANRLSSFADKFPNLSSALAVTTSTLAVAVVGVSALGYAVLGIGYPIVTICGHLAKWQMFTKLQAAATRGLAIAQGGLNMVMNMNPIARVILLIFGLVSVAQFLYNNFDSIQSKWTEVWQNFKQSHPVIAAALEGIWSALTAPYRMICNLVDKVKEMIGLEPSAKMKYTELDDAYKSGPKEDWNDQMEIPANARGGIYGKGAFLTTFAEESPEAAIPLDGSPRAVGLWQQAGQMLGVNPSGGGGGSISATFAPQIHIAGNADTGTAQQIQQVMQDSLADFERKLNALQNQKERVSLA